MMNAADANQFKVSMSRDVGNGGLGRETSKSGSRQVNGYTSDGRTLYSFFNERSSFGPDTRHPTERTIVKALDSGTQQKFEEMKGRVASTEQQIRMKNEYGSRPSPVTTIFDYTTDYHHLVNGVSQISKGYINESNIVYYALGGAFLFYWMFYR
jgi:hypothetical protein